MLKESELILTPEKRIYHIDLRPDELADTVITVGDPKRVERVSRYFDEIEVKAQHREFITHTGYLNGKRLSVISTGIGTPNIDIVINELDALFNIDFDTRTIKPEKKSLNIVRLGTAGGMQADMPVGCLALTEHAIGLDNLLCFYQLAQNDAEQQLTTALNEHFDQQLPVQPYIVEGAKSLRDKLKHLAFTGMTATCPGFYGPQNRILRGPIKLENLLDNLSNWQVNDERVINFEMETSAIYGMAKLLGHQACSISAVIVNRQTGEVDPNMQQTVDKMIQSVLAELTS